MEHNEYRPPFFKWFFLHVVPALFFLIVGAAIIFGIAQALRKPPVSKPIQKILPVVEVIEATPQTVQAKVESQGTVEARTQTALFAEVSGRVESISPSLYAGGFFKKGDVLAKIEDIDYQAALAMAKSRFADAQVAYEQELAFAEQAVEDWKTIGSEDEPNPLVLREPQLARAEANLEAAKASIISAERDLSRTVVKAPYNGRVHTKHIDVGQFLNARSSQIASIYATDTAEVRLGITLDDTRLIELPETYADGSSPIEKPKVILTANYGNVDYEWEGVIDRTVGTVDPQTRLLYLVAQIPEPYNPVAGKARPPLKIGSFVTARILGKRIDDAYYLPRRALRPGDIVYVIKGDRTLEMREVKPFQKTTEFVILREGLNPGEMICLTPLQYVVNGMEVRLSTDEAPSRDTPQDTEVADANDA